MLYTCTHLETFFPATSMNEIKLGMLWIEARDAAEQAIMHRTACHDTEVSVLIVNNAQAEKLSYKQKKKGKYH